MKCTLFMTHYEGFFDCKKQYGKSESNIELRYITDSTSKYDICRFVHSVISVFLFFALHMSLNSINVYYATNTLYITVLLLLRYISLMNLRIVIRISCVIILWIYLLSPIIMTLTEEVSTDTIYLWFFIFNLIYCIDLTKTSILNEINNTPTKKKYKSDPLTIDDTYINYRKHNICTIGYNFNILSAALLCSRCKDHNKATFLLLCDLILFVVMPYYKEKLELHKNLHFTIVYVILGSIVTYLCDTALFVGYCISVYGILIGSIIFIDGLNYYIDLNTNE